VVLDLQETLVLANRPHAERQFYAWVGPGAKRGLNRIAGRPYRNALTRNNAQTELEQLYRVLRKRRRLPTVVHTGLTMHDVQFSLCEFDKYERALWGQGTPKQRYVPRGLV
jgi:hypothetical protein